MSRGSLLPVFAASGLADRIRNRTARALNHRWRMRPYRSDERHIVIGGSPRSGTTLLRQFLDAHPDLCCGPETSVFLPGRLHLERIALQYRIGIDELRGMIRTSRSQAEFIDAFASQCLALNRCQRWAEKTPLNIWHVGWILDRFPRASIVHVVRDGRDVVCSMREYPDKRWEHDHWEDRPRDLPLEEYARRWVVHTGKGLAWREDPRYVEIRYESLTTDPEAVLDDLLEKVGVASTSSAAGFVDPSTGAVTGAASDVSVRTSSIGRWRSDLSSADLATVLRVAGPRLRELGYLD